MKNYRVTLAKRLLRRRLLLVFLVLLAAGGAGFWLQHRKAARQTAASTAVAPRPSVPSDTLLASAERFQKLLREAGRHSEIIRQQFAVNKTNQFQKP